MALVAVNGLHSLIKREQPLFFFREFWLGRTPIIVDANSISKRLYRDMPNRRDCFGGDYDMYANAVRFFFGRLKITTATTYVTFFGGRARHTPQMIEELQNIINIMQEVQPNSEQKHVMYPLWIREVFLQIVEELKLPRLQFDYEDYMSTAILCRYVHGGVVADDPNFFLYNVKYVPYEFIKFEKCDSTMVLDSMRRHMKCVKYYISQVFETGVLVNYLGLKKEKELLPIFAAFVSYEDLSDDEGFRRLFQNLGIEIVEDPPPLKEVLSSWIRKTDKDTLRAKLEQLFHESMREFVWNDVQRVVKSYGVSATGYFSYFVDPRPNAWLSKNENVLNVVDYVPKVFLDRFRNGIYPPDFVEIIQLHKYYTKPQIELVGVIHTHDISTYMISAIFKLLTNNKYHFSIFIREFERVEEKLVHAYKFDLPDMVDFQNMSPSSRKRHFNDMLILANVQTFLECLNGAPDEWKLFLVALKVFINSSRNWTLVYGLIISKLVLTKIDDTLGLYRETINFQQQFQPVMGDFKPEKMQPGLDTVKDMIGQLPFNECMLFMSKVVHHFKMNPALESGDEAFNRPVMHSLCQFQSCLLHVKYLNDLMFCPYRTVDITRTINGTFVYNLTIEMMKDGQNYGYILDNFRDTPVLFNILKTLVTQLEESTSIVI